jgi:hypothetical protein
MSGGDTTKEVSDVVDEFHSVVFKILKICKKIEPNNIDIEWLQNKLSLARDVDPLMIINRSKDKIWYYRQQILNEDGDFFLNNTFAPFIKNDKNKTFMYTLLNLIKKRFAERSNEEKKMLWGLGKSMLASVIKYKKLIKDYSEE